MNLTISKNSTFAGKTIERVTRLLRSAGAVLNTGKARTVSSYAMAFITVGLGTVFRIALDPVLGEHHPFTLYFAAVAITAWYGGFLPATVAIILAYFAADWFFITPRFEINWPHENVDEFMALMAFLFSGFAIAITSKIMRSALSRARQKTLELQQEVLERQRAEQALQLAQSQLRQHAALLEERVQERTAHLQETIRSLQGVCYHIAHDLRAPLRAMEGFTSLLLENYSEALDATAQRHVRRIGDSAQRMDLLIHGLLEYGRLGIENFPLARTDSRRCLSHVLLSLEAEISTKDAEITLEEHWPEVWGNQSLVELVFFHLVSNALKFVAPGATPRIRVRAENRDSMIRFWVEDEGIGISSEHLHNAFKIFQHLHPRENYPGTGIGLAITAKGVEIMRGSIGVESVRNQGSRFWFELVPATTPDFTERMQRTDESKTLAFSL